MVLETSTTTEQELSPELTTRLLDFIKLRTGMIFAPRLLPWVKKQFFQIFEASNAVAPELFALDLISGKFISHAQALFESLTVHETMFYRDKRYFDFITNHMLPTLVEQNESKKSLGIWIAAGSSGQEIYSILFTIVAHFPKLIKEGWRLNLYSTDISNQIITKAKVGIYEKHEVGRGLDDAGLAKFFDQVNEKSWQVKDEYRDMVNFKTSNLVQDFTSDVPDVDFISCRNVLIYFNDETKFDIISRLSKKVNKNGFLLLGQVDYINTKIPPEGFDYKMEGTFPYYRKA